MRGKKHRDHKRRINEMKKRKKKSGKNEDEKKRVIADIRKEEE